MSTSGVTYSIKSGDIARFSMVDGRIERLQKIEELDSKVVKVDDTYVYTADNQKYQYSDKVVVYQLDANWKRKIIPLSEIKGRDDLSLTASSDRLPGSGRQDSSSLCLVKIYKNIPANSPGYFYVIFVFN